ncbi:hypothetical protein Goshw_023779 [Gossypium schwendimanii]|uniref:DUF7745 domain-containing protein n=1 Tax=Gossypium schwendimanii TaxID=34291 RepID=A0A7J9N532_GOSSC|nr:hypothetical protein [Gossypium schwendimanii]
MVIRLIYSMSKYISTYFELVPNIGIPPIVALLLEKAVNIPTLLKRLMSITGMSEQWVATRIKQKDNNKCIPWKSLQDLILAHSDTKKRVDVFALSIYKLVIFPKVLGHIDEAVSDLFDRLNKRVTPVLIILAETFRSLSACRRTSEGRFIEYSQLWLAWFHSYFWKVEKIFYRVFSKNYSLLKEFIATLRRDNIFEEKWMTISKSRQFIPTTQGLDQCEFAYKGDNYKKKRSSELGKKIKKLKEEKIKLRLDVDVQKLEAGKMRKGKHKAEEYLDSLKTYYKKLCLSMRTTGLDALKRDLLESQNEKVRLKAQVTELERSLHQYRSRNSAIELKASLKER